MGAAIIPRMTAMMSDAGGEVEMFPLGVTWEVRAFWRKGAYIGEPEQEFMALAEGIFGGQEKTLP